MALPPADGEEFSKETREASPAHLLIKIESFSLLSENGIWEYESREFEAGGHKWRLIIYPNGDESGKKGDHISVHLSMVDTNSLPPDWEVNATFTIFLLNQISDNYVCFRGGAGKARRFHAMNTKWRFSKLISKKSLTDPSNGYLVDDNCVFGAEVSVIKSQRVFERVSVQKATKLHKHVLVISQFSKLGNVWYSEEFTAGDYRWTVELHPNGFRSGKGHSVSIYVYCVDCKSFAPHEKLRADICIRIKNKFDGTHHSHNLSEWFSSSDTNWGYDNFIPIVDMRVPAKGFVVDDCCFLEIEISVKVVVRDAPKPKEGGDGTLDGLVL